MLINNQNFNEIENFYSLHYETILFNKKWNVIYLLSNVLSTDFLKNNNDYELIFSKTKYTEKRNNIKNILKENIDNSGNLGKVKDYVYEILKKNSTDFMEVLEERIRFFSQSSNLTEFDYKTNCNQKNVKIYNEMIEELNSFISKHNYIKNILTKIINEFPSDLIEDKRKFNIQLSSLITVSKDMRKKAEKKYELILDTFNSLLLNILNKEELHYREEIRIVLSSVVEKEVEDKIRLLNSREEIPSIPSIKIKSTIFKNNNYINTLIKRVIELIKNENIEIEKTQEKTSKIYLTTIYKKIKYNDLYSVKTERKQRSTKEEMIFKKGSYEEKENLILSIINDLSKKFKSNKYLIGKYNNKKIYCRYDEDSDENTVNFFYLDNNKNEILFDKETNKNILKDIVKHCSIADNSYIKYEFMNEESVKSILPTKKENIPSIAKYIEIENENEISSKLPINTTEQIKNINIKNTVNFNF
jgi:hypothetical protein